MITPNGIALPALYLYSLNASFINKHIHLPPGQRVKIGRQTNAKSVPGERNGFFDSKVLSRAHAEVWEEGGKIFIKDVKSSNGTFINSERLSPESAESEPFELKTDDIVEFGIDIVGEDNKTVVHHKVAARVVCVFTPEDAAAAARAEQHQPAAPSFHGGHPHQQQHQQHQQPASGANNPNAFFRRPGAAQQVAGIGGMGGGPARAPGKNALTFDHILNRLQGELQKSRETGAELHALTGAMGEIHDSLGAGALHGEHKALAQGVPPIPPPQPAQREPERSSSVNDGALAELQAQLNATQRALADHVDKVRSLESALAGQEAVRAEVAALREMLDAQREHAQSSSHHDDEHSQEREDDDDDDARSIVTVTPHELETVTEEEEEAEQEPEQPAMRPRTPEPNMHYASASSSSTPASPPAASAALPAEIDARLSALSAQLESALEQGRTLSAQHTAAQTTITALASRLSAIEGVRGEWNAWESGAHAREDAQIGKIEKMVKDTVGGFKAAWDREREAERAREREEREKERQIEREERAKDRELLGVTIKKEEQDEKRTGLVTPPSPRSVSADSTGKRRRRRASTSRGRRGRSTDSISALVSAADGHDEHEDSSSEGASSSAILDEKASVASVATGGLPLPRKRGAMLAWLSDAEADAEHDSKSKYGPREGGALQAPGTVGKPVQQWTTVGGLGKHQVEASIGLLLVGVAVGAVMWRVVPE
ncbi:hypothetical protein PENSPDRAFT_646772 [Peniophora sp. CONT]|nr:hypothetical protein PENSPDRAFT_646772 [Peniophora sp. CONT]